MQVKLKFGPSGSIFDRVIILELRKKPNKNSSVQTNVTIKRHLTFWLLAGAFLYIQFHLVNYQMNTIFNCSSHTSQENLIGYQQEITNFIYSRPILYFLLMNFMFYLKQGLIFFQKKRLCGLKKKWPSHLFIMTLKMKLSYTGNKKK